MRNNVYVATMRTPAAPVAFRIMLASLMLSSVFCAVVGFPCSASAADAAKFVTSEKCKECHPEIYKQWKMTPHARMLRNARKDSSAVLADRFTEEIPFQKKDIEFTLGSHWIQKYLTRIGQELYILPKFWNIVKGEWEPYSIWNWQNRPYSEHCNWCHSVGYDTRNKTFVEESIGCEACHGPGGKHAETAKADDIINPAKLSKMLSDMICEACHTDGKDRETKTYPYPAGYAPGEDLRDYYTDFFMPKPGSKGWYRGEATYMERHRMFLYWQSSFYSTARSCEVCEFDRGITVKEKRYMSRDEYCGTCHGAILAEFELHSKHSRGDATCAECHAPMVDATGQRYSIHDHKFDFSGPELPCAECHADELKEISTDPPHKFNFSQVQIRENITPQQACDRCHAGAKLRSH
ncbi:hypothetical protein HZA56_13705 [Candidatus Poribacteria bacterium]|nr:hypothetical protein [Candidatus Poribacteria bacterium]